MCGILYFKLKPTEFMVFFKIHFIEFEKQAVSINDHKIVMPLRFYSSLDWWVNFITEAIVNGGFQKDKKLRNSFDV